jgi:TRAP-type C4-dicarboxylate transport system permease small subunit
MVKVLFAHLRKNMRSEIELTLWLLIGCLCFAFIVHGWMDVWEPRSTADSLREHLPDRIWWQRTIKGGFGTWFMAEVVHWWWIAVKHLREQKNGESVP